MDSAVQVQPLRDAAIDGYVAQSRAAEARNDYAASASALDKALRLALEPVFPQLKEILLRDYKVRILESQQGAGARVRVLVETADGDELFGTVGAGENIIEASWQALKDALEFKLLRDEQRKSRT